MNCLFFSTTASFENAVKAFFCREWWRVWTRATQIIRILFSPLTRAVFQIRIRRKVSETIQLLWSWWWNSDWFRAKWRRTRNGAKRPQVQTPTRYDGCRCNFQGNMPRQWMCLCVTESCSWRYFFFLYLSTEYAFRRGLNAGVSQLTANEVIRCSALVIITIQMYYYSFLFYFNTCALRVIADWKVLYAARSYSIGLLLLYALANPSNRYSLFFIWPRTSSSSFSSHWIILHFFSLLWETQI